MEEDRSTFKILTGKLNGKQPIDRHRYEDNIRMDIKEIGVNMWIGLIQLRIRTTGEYL